MEENVYNFTKNMRKIYEENFEALKSFYTKEDFERLLNEFDDAEEDTILFTDELETMCKLRGIDLKELLKDRSILDTIPTKEKLKNDLLEAFYTVYKNIPTTIAFMERIVKRLAPEYEKYSCRLAMLKKFVQGTKFENGEFKFKTISMDAVLKYAMDHCTYEEKVAYDKMSDQQKKDLIISKLEEDIFDLKTSEFTVMDMKKVLVSRIDTYQDELEIQFDPKTVNQVDTVLKQNKMYDEKDSFSQKVDKLTDESLLLQIEEQFVSILRQKKRKNKNNEESDYATLYEEAIRSATRALSDRDGLEILNLCNDLSLGNFRVNGKTKQRLYYFGFMFHMIFYYKKEDTYNKWYDINKNLFHDYYNDNLLRFLSGDYIQKNSNTSLEAAPTGEGINYKNFAEIIYLYYLDLDDKKLLPSERIDLAEKMIRKCLRENKKLKDKKTNKVLHKNTEEYENIFIEKILSTDKKHLPEVICDHFNLDTNEKARIVVESEEITAFKLYRDILLKRFEDAQNLINIDSLNAEVKWYAYDLLKEKYAYDKDFIRVMELLDKRVSSEIITYGLFDCERMYFILKLLFQKKGELISSTTISEKLKNANIETKDMQLYYTMKTLQKIGFNIHKEVIKSVAHYSLQIDHKESPEISRILNKLSNFYFVSNLQDDKQLMELCIRDKKITRYSFILQFLQFFIEKSIQYFPVLSEKKNEEVFIEEISFPELLEEFKSEIDSLLMQARYQTISENNIFDMYIVLNLYFYLCENHG